MLDAPAVSDGVIVRIADAPLLPWLALLAVALVAIGAILERAFARGRALQANTDHRKSPERAGVVFACILAAAAVLRIVLAAASPGMPADIAAFTRWSQTLAGDGMPGFYARVPSCVYPPGYLYLLCASGWAARLLSLSPDSPAFLLALKLPAILADIAAALLLWRLAKKRIGAARATVIASLFAVNPAMILDSAVWGQADSVLALFMVLAVDGIDRGRLERAGVFLAVAVLVKPFGLIIAPVLLAALVERRSLQCAGRTALAGLGVFAALCLPFALGSGPLAVLSPYLTGVRSYPFAAMNSFNLYALVGANWADAGAGVFFIPYAAWSLAFLALIAAGTCLLYLRAGPTSKDRVHLIAALACFAAFIFARGMHERSLFPAVVMAAFAAAQSGSRKLGLSWVALSALLFLDQAVSLNLSAVFSSTRISADDPLLRLFGLLAVALFIATAGVCLSALGLRGKPRPVLISSRASRTDILAMLGLTLLSTLAFIRLGSVSAPRTFYAAASAGETVTADLRAETNVERVSAYVGLGSGAYRVELSRDGVTWQPAMRIEQPSLFGFIEWRTAPVQTRARYLRLTAESPGLRLGELGAFAEDRRVLPMSYRPSAASAATGAERLFDEQKEIPFTPDSSNGTYFDETYFARAAWEYVQGIEPTETSHPPLGKLLIASGVLLFGMTPFGWRFMPALAGVLAVPLLYLLARRLSNRRDLALLAALLFCFDFMRFVIGRTAMVDSFVVFFLLLAYAGAYSVWTDDQADPCSKRAWLRLLGVGAALGAACACKWEGAFGAAGVVLLFVVSGVRHGAGKLATTGADPGKRTVAGAAGMLILQGVVCLVAVPVIVYAAAYIPDVIRSGLTVSDVLSRQFGMFQYHAGVTETRWYSSAWWEWPLIVRPIWLYSGSMDLPPGDISSIVLMGNPAVWWVGGGAVAASAVVGWWLRDRRAAFVLTAFLAQYLPWLFSARSLLFIYHFFPAVPFMILSVTYLSRLLVERFARARGVLIAHVGAAAVLFALFLPLLTGPAVPRAYAETLHWFSSWVFFPP